MIIEERIAVTWLSSIPKNPIKPKFIITAEVNGTIAKIPQSTLLKNKDASTPITKRDANMLINDERTIKITKSLNTTIIPVTSILTSSLKLISI